MSEPTDVLAVIASALEYLVDRGEIELIEKVTPNVRYIHPPPHLDKFRVKVGKQRFEITAREILKTPKE